MESIARRTRIDAPPLKSIAYWDRSFEVPKSTMSKAKKRVFSIVKAVKQNARDRVGQPPPEKILPDPKQKAAAKPKHKETLADLLQKSDAD